MQKAISHQPLIIVSNPTVRLHIIELCIIYLKIIMIQQLILPRSEENRAYLKMGELLFNMHETFPETYFPISTVQNEGNIEAHHIFKNANDPTEEEREIGRRPKLLCIIISFCFPEKVRCWFLSNELCAFKSLRSVSRGMWEEQYIKTSEWSNGGF